MTPAYDRARGVVAQLVTRDYKVVMKRVGIADLKAHLSEHLKTVRRGHEITVVDRGTPVARILPAERTTPLATRKPTRDLHSIKLPRPLPYQVDSLAALLEERGER